MYFGEYLNLDYSWGLRAKYALHNTPEQHDSTVYLESLMESPIRFSVYYCAQSEDKICHVSILNHIENCIDLQHTSSYIPNS